MLGDKNPTRPDPSTAPSWPTWARRLATVALVLHLTAILAAALSAEPASPLERGVAAFFARYYEVSNQGFAYRYYAHLDRTVDPEDPAPWGTPLILAKLQFADGRIEEFYLHERPGPSRPRPRLTPRPRYQRHLALENHLFEEVQELAAAGRNVGQESRWARSYARHLCITRGCRSVRLAWQEHRIPPLERVRDAASRTGTPPLDLDADEFKTVPVTIGEYPCDAF